MTHVFLASLLTISLALAPKLPVKKVQEQMHLRRDARWYMDTKGHAVKCYGGTRQYGSEVYALDCAGKKIKLHD